MHEKISLDFSFEETRSRGKEKFQCVLRATELGATAGNVDEILVSNSWDDFKKQYPTLNDILIRIFPTDSWNPSWRGGHRSLCIGSISGHEGLYDFDQDVEVSVDWDTDIMQ